MHQVYLKVLGYYAGKEYYEAIQDEDAPVGQGLSGEVPITYVGYGFHMTF